MAGRADTVGVMALITPEYMEIQKKLHESQQGHYGTGVHLDKCSEFIRTHAKPDSTILDYGCGNGALKKELAEFDVREYDPCVEGKDDRPDRADFVVCADVLEHVEESCIENVIAHIRELTKNLALIVIDCKPAQKTLSDGRNAHILIKPPYWWREKLEPLFRLEQFEYTFKDYLIVVAEPTVKMVPGMLKAIGVVDDSERNEYVGKNIGKTWKRIPDCPQPAHDRLLAVACYGPSIANTWENLKKQAEHGGVDVVSVSGAHDFLKSKKIKPTFHVECDPRIHKSRMIKKPLKGVKYLMASCCHPEFIERLAPYDLTLWHLFNGEESYEIRDYPSEKMAAMIPGGGSVGLRTLTLFYFLGYRNFILHGFDCSYADDGKTHAGKHTGKFRQDMRVRVDGTDKWFTTAPVMITYANHMLDDIKTGRYPGCQFWFEGDGLFQTMLAQYLKETAALKAANPGGVEPPQGFGRDYFSLREEDARPDETFPNRELV
jgi:hypothetical protein